MDGSSQAPSGMSPASRIGPHRRGHLVLLSKKACFSGDFPFPWAEILYQRSSRVFCLSSLCLCLSSLVRNKCEMAEPLFTYPAAPLCQRRIEVQNHQISPLKSKSCSKTFSPSELFFYCSRFNLCYKTSVPKVLRNMSIHYLF